MAGILAKSTHRSVVRKTVVIVGIGIAIILAAFLIATARNFYRSGTDFFSLWLGPHLLVEGKNPYDPVDWGQAHVQYGTTSKNSPYCLYPLPLVVLMIPLGLLPLELAAVVWLSLSLTAILVSAYVTFRFRSKFRPAGYWIPAVIGILLFRPIAVIFYLGQIDWLVLLLLAVGLYYLEKRQFFLGAIWITLTIVKPQVGLPILGFFTIWLIFRRLWNSLLAEGITLLALFSLGWFLDQAWLLHWMQRGRTVIDPLIGYTPTIWGISSLACKHNNCGFTLGAILSVIMSVVLIIKLARTPTYEVRYVLGFLIPVALLVSPYLWIYSQAILLIPILICLDVLVQRQSSYMLVAPFTLYIALFSSTIVFLSIRIGEDVLSALVPLTILVLLYGLYRLHNSQYQHNPVVNL